MLKAAADTTEQFIIIFNDSAGQVQTAVSTSMMPLLMPPKLTRRTKVVAGHAAPLAPSMPNPGGNMHFCNFMASIQHVAVLFHRISRCSEAGYGLYYQSTSSFPIDIYGEHVCTTPKVWHPARLASFP
jgi:hypothetical protein